MITYIPNYVEPEVADLQLKRLWEELDWEQRPDAPRREYWQNDFGLPYTYGVGRGERTYECKSWDPFVYQLCFRLNETLDVFPHINCCFVNGYANERNSLGWHSDGEPFMDNSAPIATISLGEEREIQTKDKVTGVVESYVLGHGSLFVMPPGFQQTHLHRIPRGSRAMGPRVSLTYRRMLIL